MKNKFQLLIAAQRLTNVRSILQRSLAGWTRSPNLIGIMGAMILAVLTLSVGIGTWVNAQQSPTIPRNQVEIEQLLEDFGQGNSENFFITLPREGEPTARPFVRPTTQPSEALPTPPPAVEPPPVEEVPPPPSELFRPEASIPNTPVPSFPPPNASIVPSNLVPIPIPVDHTQPAPPTSVPPPKEVVPPILIEEEEEVSEVIPQAPIDEFQIQIYPPSRYAAPPLKHIYRNQISPPRYPNIPTPPNQSELTDKEKLVLPEDAQTYTFELPPEEKSPPIEVQALPPETRPDQILLEGLAGTLQSNVHVTPPFEQSYLSESEDPRLSGEASPLDRRLAEQGLPQQEALALKSIIEIPEDNSLDNEPTLTLNEDNLINRYVEPLFAERYRDPENLQRIVNAETLPEDPPGEQRDLVEKEQSSAPAIITLPPVVANSNTPEHQLSEEELVALLLQARRYALINRYSEALFLLRFVQVRQPDNLVMLNMKGSIYYKINRLEMALAYWKRSLNLNPYQPLVTAYEQRLENYLFQLREQLTAPEPTSSG